METANRTLTPDVIAALRYWPGILYLGQKNPPASVDLTVLPPFFNGLLRDHERSIASSTEVSVPGTVSSGSGESLPFVAQVSFKHDQLLRSHAKVGDVVIRPADAPAGQPEPHPFAKVFTRLMDLRGIPVGEMARQTSRSMSTIHMLRSGELNPHPVLVKEISPALAMSEADIRVIAGVDDGND